MKQSTINLENINIFLTAIDSLEDIKKNPFYKKLRVSPTSFFILRYLFQKYVSSNEFHFITTTILKQLSESIVFRSLLAEDEEKSLFLKNFNDYVQEDLEQTDLSEISSINENIYNEFDFYENEYINIGFIKYIEVIKELIDYGYIYSNDQEIYSDNIFELFGRMFVLSPLFIDIINEGDIIIKEFNNKTPYLNYIDYLDDAFSFIQEKHEYHIMKKYLNSKSPILEKYKIESEKHHSQVKYRLSKSKNIENPLIDFFNKNQFTEQQELIILTLFRSEFFPDNNRYNIANHLMYLYLDEEEDSFILKLNNFDFDTNIVVTEYSENSNPLSNEIIPIYYLEQSVLEQISITKKSFNTKSDKKVSLFEVESIVKENTDFEIIQPDVNIEDLVLSQETNDLVHLLLSQLDPKVYEQLAKWGIKNTNTINARIIFSGKAGTGKTATAHALGKALDKYIISFDCSKILSQYVGESEKNVKLIFDTYKKVKDKLDYYPILLLNEADQFLGTRSTGSISGSQQMYNQMQNIFLEEIEKFEGILIGTTNLIENLDSAFSRRFNYKIEFKIPDKSQRLQIWKNKINKNMPLEKSFDFNKLSEFELTGGQINLILENVAMNNAVNKIKKFSTQHFIDGINKELNSSFDKKSNSMGFLKR